MGFSHHEPEILIEFMSQRQVPQFSTKIVIKKLQLKKKKDFLLKKPRELSTRDEKDTFLM